MNDERFEVVQDPRVQTEYFIYDNENKISSNITDYPFGDQDVCSRIVRLLNGQQATIRRLQDLCGESDGENAKLRIENKMLEKEVNLLRPTNLEQFEQIQKLQEENEELRQTMQKVCELLGEEVDLFSDKATEHDVIAYREMQDFDNKDAYYMCISTKKAIKMLQRCF